MKVLVVLNPISGGKDKATFLCEAKDLCAYYGIELEIFKTTGENDVALLKKQLEDLKPDRLAAAGGDGTFALCCNTLLQMDDRIPLGIIPLGSANGMAKELAVPENPLDALKDVLISQVTGKLDLLKVNEEHVLMHIGDVGINARIVKQFEADKNRGMLTYGKYFMKELRTSTQFAANVKIGDEAHEEEVFMLAICNARKFGTGVPLNTKSNPFDGLFELVAIRSIEIDQILSAGLAALDEDLLSVEKNVAYQCEKAEVTFTEPRLLQIDGEVIGEFDHLKIKLLKGAINFISNGKNQYLLS